ncbi:nitrate reductase molybdenum cofactor assembly chaperone [Amycolatopsis aidingensis]|uniref:nitrate reductase molybdenum cofactor assembly chaperone n=1 Tax=Amycolatopsis aidingensis TaxID=2842453 RepID=UPI001C0DE9E7|nr:nitrate reductase molybdenum cofactor assembly chaperone [Amycolatopsis aidingensis]
MTDRARVLRLVSLLLQYPDEELLAGRAELAGAVRRLTDPAQRAHLDGFLDWFLAADPLEPARHYVETFDLRRRSSLYLTYYLHGDTRRRGMALLLLKQRYRAAGLVPPAGELPDFLPIVCEFAALEGQRGEAPLRQHRQGIELIRTALHEAGSPYAGVLDALCELLPGLSAAQRRALTELAADGPPAEEVGLDPFVPPQYLTGTEARA